MNLYKTTSFILLLFSLLLVFVLNISSIEKFRNDLQSTSPIYCIMVTGKSECRHHLVKKSIVNFKEQDYSNKTLIILNHGDKIALDEPSKDKNIFEFKIKKTDDLKLGDIRNIGLNLVPPEAYWTTWDDDDYRSTDYLSYLYYNGDGSDIVAFANRFEFNYVTKFFWKTTWLRGFPTCLVKRDMRFKYLSQDTMEDVNLFTEYAKLGKSIKVLKDNDPRIYLRLVHTDNTSVWINKNKTGIAYSPNKDNYYESEVSSEVEQNQSTFLYKYYQEGLECMLNSSKRAAK